MTDRPASWLTDPTGRHDHRYWDGSRWTDHVADAGVAATDPYDGPADATAESPTTPEASTPSGWASTTEPSATEPAATVSGWGASTEDEDATGYPVTPAAPTTPWSTPTWGETAAASTTGEPTPTATSPWGPPATPSWGAAAPTDTGPAPEADEADSDEAAGADEAPAVTTMPVASWGAPTGVGPSTTWDEPVDADSPTSTWGTPIAPAPATPTGSDSRKGLALALALIAIVVVVVALVATRDDKGSDSDGSTFASQISEQFQAQTAITEEQGDCIGEYVVDEVGASRLEGVQSLQDQSVSPELQEDLNEAVQKALTECDVAQGDLSAPPTGGTDDAGNVATDTESSGQVMTESQYLDYYRGSLGLSEEDARCLAEKSAEAEAAGEINQGDGISQFYQFVDECGIDSEELFQTIATADASNTGG